MSHKIIPKKVELTELFYDLVFVYAVSQLTELLHDFPEGSNFFQQLIIYSVITIVFINTWMVETVFTNRYGKNSIGNILFFMFDMGIVLFMSNNFTGGITDWFQPFALAASLLSFTLVLQYLHVFIRTNNQIDKDLARLFIYILFLRTILLLIGAILPFKIGLSIALLGILSSWILPGIFTSKMTQRAINFPHLLERLTALIIISFGETIVDIAPYFKAKDFSIYSIMIFLIICGLFMNYITQFDHFIDESKINATGNRLIYLHYPILFGISLLTAALDFIGEMEFSKLLAIGILYSGLILFYLGIFLADFYNKADLKKETHVRICFIGTTILGFIFCSLFRSFHIIVIVTTLVVMVNTIVMSESMIRQTNN